ncbi:FAD-dependent monooxygenase [Nonomuraea sp. NPDC003804]|uniref:FAD-dependent monooxygenase n=1 Tax=Nonomuraea sp. NPDC003804 TaxID=3154547 RepID=UPI0033A8EF46
MRTESTSVLVVGGGLVGLSATVFLSWRGVPAMVVERRTAGSPHPRAVGYTPRTLELLRAVGLGSRVPQVPAGSRLRRARVHSLAVPALPANALTVALSRVSCATQHTLHATRHATGNRTT